MRLQAMKESANTHSGCDDKAQQTQAACEAAGHTWRDVVYSYYDTDNSVLKMSSFLSDAEETTGTWCSIAEHKMSGFVRTEVFFSVLTEIFANKSASLDLRTGCKVTSIEPETVRVGSRIKVATHKACKMGERLFDRVVVSASAASVGLLSEADAVLDKHLIAVKGYGLVGVVNDTSMVVEDEQFARGLHFIDHGEDFQAAYARATTDMRVKIWGGECLVDASKDRYSAGSIYIYFGSIFTALFALRSSLFALCALRTFERNGMHVC